MDSPVQAPRAHVAPVVPFNSIEWIPEGEGYEVSVELKAMAFNSIEWILVGLNEQGDKFYYAILSIPLNGFYEIRVKFVTGYSPFNSIEWILGRGAFLPRV